MNENKTQDTTERSRPRDPIYIIIILLLLIGGGVLYWDSDQKSQKLEECAEANRKLDKDLNYVISELGSDPEEFKADLNDLLTDYDTLISINSELGEKKDLLMDSLMEQRDKILQLQKEVQAGKWSAVQLRKKEKELEVLRRVMQGYVHRIDSLITENDLLRGRLDESQEQLTQATETIDKYAQKTTKLEETVAAGQVLKTTGISATGIRLKRNGDQRETNRARRANRVKSCFTLMENRIAKANTKTLYMRVIAPTGNVLAPSSSQTFNMGKDREGIYSVSRDIDYQNQDLEVCIYYIFELDPPPDGTYIVEIWAEGHQIGKTTFDLK